MIDWRRILGIAAVVGLASPALLATPSAPGSESTPTSALIGQNRSVQAAPALSDIGRLADFQAMFDRDRGKTRIVLLMSPT